MFISTSDRAKVLTQALPYIQKYHSKTIVIKYGGNAMLNEGLKEAVISDLVLLNLVGINVVLVHGGGPEISDNLKKMNIESVFKNGIRVTDSKTLEVAQMTLAGKINKDLVNKIRKIGASAMGICGIDGGLISAKKVSDDSYGYVGEITSINPKPIFDLINTGYIPVVATIACGDEDSDVYNINADTAAAELAVALNAEKLILLTDVKGVMKDVSDEDTLITIIKTNEIEKLKEEGIIKGGMIPKIDCCKRALDGGVKRTHVIDGRISHSILIELLSDEGIGTMFVKE